MSAIAIVSTYAPSEGFGGPARIFHMRKAFESAGHSVIHVVVQSRHERGATRSCDFVRLVERPRGEPIDHIYEDVDLARRAASDDSLTLAIRDHLRRHGVRLIILEQPFLVETVSHVADTLGVPVVYSSANVEYRLKIALERFDRNWRRPKTRSDEVKALEQRSIELASLVTAICPTDRQVLQTDFGCDSTLVPNGSVVATEVTPDAVEVPGEPVDFVVVGSAYWPNVEGVAKLATPSLAFLPPTTRLHVVGSMAGQVLREPSIVRHLSVNSARIVLRGFLDTPELIGTLRAAHAVLVPIFSGEGSNLKSADALASGRPVIMTRRATYGYEDVIAADPVGVTIVDTPGEFRAAMSEVLASPRSGTVGDERRRALSWSERLRPLLMVVGGLVQPATGA